MPEAEITIPALFAALTGYQRTGTLKGAIDLDLFTAIAEGNDTVVALARRVGANERGVRILCDSLAAMGFLTKSGSRYGLAAGCERILRKVHRCLKPGGRAVTLEFVPNDDRVSPPEAATFSLVMLVTTPSGDAYTFAELERMAKAAGFARSDLHELPPTFARV